MKIVLHLEIDEEDLNEEFHSKARLQVALSERLNESINEIADWCEVTEYIEDERDKNRIDDIWHGLSDTLKDNKEGCK